MKPKIAVDFDGTIARCYWDESGPSFQEGICGEIIVGAADFIRALAKKYDVIIFSARASTFRGKNAILEWIKQNNLRGVITEVTNEKKYSFVALVDDRAIAFSDPNDYVSIAKYLGCEITKEN